MGCLFFQSAIVVCDWLVAGHIWSKQGIPLGFLPLKTYPHHTTIYDVIYDVIIYDYIDHIRWLYSISILESHSATIVHRLYNNHNDSMRMVQGHWFSQPRPSFASSYPFAWNVPKRTPSSPSAPFSRRKIVFTVIDTVEVIESNNDIVIYIVEVFVFLLWITIT